MYGQNISTIGTQKDLSDLKGNPLYQDIDFDYLVAHERKSTRNPNLGYTPKGTVSTNSGITVGMGVDLARVTLNYYNGKYTADGTQISKGLYDKIQPYSGYYKNGEKQFGLRGQDAINATANTGSGTLDQRRNVQLTLKETKELNNAKFSFVYNKVKKDYDDLIGTTSGSFNSLSSEMKTTLLSMGWNMGENFIRSGKNNKRDYYNTLVGGHLTGDFTRFSKVLQGNKWSHRSRRNDEGKYLERSLNAKVRP